MSRRGENHDNSAMNANMTTHELETTLQYYKDRLLISSKHLNSLQTRINQEKARQPATSYSQSLIKLCNEQYLIAYQALQQEVNAMMQLQLQLQKTKNNYQQQSQQENIQNSNIENNEQKYIQPLTQQTIINNNHNNNTPNNTKPKSNAFADTPPVDRRPTANDNNYSNNPYLFANNNNTSNMNMNNDNYASPQPTQLLNNHFIYETPPIHNMEQSKLTAIVSTVKTPSATNESPSPLPPSRQTSGMFADDAMNSNKCQQTRIKQFERDQSQKSSTNLKLFFKSDNDISDTSNSNQEEIKQQEDYMNITQISQMLEEDESKSYIIYFEC